MDGGDVDRDTDMDTHMDRDSAIASERLVCSSSTGSPALAGNRQQGMMDQSRLIVPLRHCSRRFLRWLKRFATRGAQPQTAACQTTDSPVLDLEYDSF